MSVNNVLFELILDIEEGESLETSTVTGTIKRPKRPLTSDDFTDKLVKYTCNIIHKGQKVFLNSAYIRSVYHTVTELNNSSGPSIQFTDAYIIPYIGDGVDVSKLLLSYMDVDGDSHGSGQRKSWYGFLIIADKYFSINEINEVFVDEFHREEKYI